MRAFRLALTGSIGMGKSTTSRMFVAEGIPVWDADEAVHRLYASGGAAVDPVSALCPDAKGPNGIDRMALRRWIASDPSALLRLESVVHPLVTRDRADFLDRTTSDLVVCDIPLLFETAAQTDFDATLLVTAPAAIQKERVMARPGMTEDQFNLIRSRQMPDAKKRALATHVVETLSPEQTRSYVCALIDYLKARHA